MLQSHRLQDLLRSTLALGATTLLVVWVSAESAGAASLTKTPATSQVPEGCPAIYEITVSGLCMTDLQVTDPLAPDCTTPVACGHPRLDSWLCPPQVPKEFGVTLTYTCRSEPLTSSFANTATLTGRQCSFSVVGCECNPIPPPTPIEVSASASVEVLPTGLTVAEEPPAQLVAPGDAATFQITVTNSGQVALSSVSVEGSQASDCNRVLPDLAPGESTSYDCTTGPLTAGFTDAITASGSYGCADESVQSVAASGGATVEVANPEIDLQKATNGHDADTAPGPEVFEGTAINWTYAVTNTGSVTLTGVAVSDDQGVAVSCPAASLDPGGSMTCTAAGTATAGQYENTGTVTATGNGVAAGMQVSDSDSSHYLGVALEPAIDLEKSTNGEDADTVPGPEIREGLPIEWRYVVRNTGNLTLTGVAVSDDQGLQVDCPSETTLAPGASLTCTASGTAVLGQYGNTATVTATSDPGGLVVSATDSSHYLGVEPPRVFDKQVAEPSELPEDCRVEWGIDLSLPGCITDVVLSDPTAPGCEKQWACADYCPQGVELQFGCSSIERVSPEMENTATLTYTSFPASAEGCCLPPQCQGKAVTVIETATASFNILHPELSIVMEPALQTVADGESASFAVTVSNVGEVHLISLSVSDSPVPDCNRELPYYSSEFGPPGTSYTYTCSSGSLTTDFTNTATVKGWHECGYGPPQADSFVEASASATVEVVPAEAAIDLEKATNGEDADTAPGPELLEGSEVEWSYAITNSGNVPLTGVAVSDDQGVTISCPGATLAPAASMTCTGSGSAKLGQYRNTATVTGSFEAGEVQVSDSDSSHYLGVEPAMTEKCFEVPSSTGSGMVRGCFVSDPDCDFTQVAAVSPADLPTPPPSGVTFPHGLVTFVVANCTPGFTMDLTLSYPKLLEAGTAFHKFGPEPGSPSPHWYVVSAAIAGNEMTISLTDGGAGDDDLSANGTIEDPCGPGYRAVPTLEAWAAAAMALLLVLLGGWVSRGARVSGPRALEP